MTMKGDKMKNILISLFIFLFTMFVSGYNFYKGRTAFGWIAAVFGLIDFAVLAIAIIKRIRK